MTAIRCFIAIPLAESARKDLLSIQKHLKTADADVKWVKEPNLHITLRFLGDRPLKKIEAVTDLLQSSFRQQAPFEIGIDHLGVFPNERSPKVLWAGAGHHGGKIKDIAARLEDGLNRLGIPKEKQEFVPHITLGRVRSAKNTKALMEKLRGHSLSSPILSAVSRITFYKSTLTAEGPVYEPITTVELAP